MPIIRFCLCVTFILLAFTARSSDDEAPIKRASAPTTNGYELFSWSTKGDTTDHFALLPATTQEKLRTPAEAMAKENVIDGVPALKRKLSALAITEKIGWYNNLAKSNEIPEGVTFDFPSREVQREVELYCSVLKLRLNIYRNKVPAK